MFDDHRKDMQHMQVYAKGECKTYNIRVTVVRRQYRTVHIISEQKQALLLFRVYLVGYYIALCIVKY